MILNLLELVVAAGTDRFKILFQIEFYNYTNKFSFFFQVSITYNGYGETTAYTELYVESNKVMVSNTITFDTDSQAFEK